MEAATNIHHSHIRISQPKSIDVKISNKILDRLVSCIKESCDETGYFDLENIQIEDAGTVVDFTISGLLYQRVSHEEYGEQTYCYDVGFCWAEASTVDEYGNQILNDFNMQELRKWLID